MKIPRGILVFAVLALGACATGSRVRDISYSGDLTAGDLAHFSALAKDKISLGAKEPIQEFTWGFPMLFLPVLLGGEEVHADRVDENPIQYHFEDVHALLLFGAANRSWANFDSKGRNLGHDSSTKVLLGLLSFSTGREKGAGGEFLVPTSSFSILWGMLGTTKTAAGRSYSLFWFPIN